MVTATVKLDLIPGLVTDAQRGDRRAAEQLVRENEGWIRSVIYSVTGRWDLVDDIAQQVWTQVWERLPSLKDPQRLRSWLYSVARHAAIDAGQSRNRRRTADLDQVAEAASQDTTTNPQRLVLGGELRETLLRAVEALPAHYREPFVLRHLEDWSYSEIGQTLGLPVETVETRLVRARRLLREMLEGKLEP